MKTTVAVLPLLLLITIARSNEGCPRATFEFFNNTIKAPYNFIDSSVGNIGSLETCPYTGRPYVYLPCYPNSTWGDEPYFSTCLKPPDQHDEPKEAPALVPSTSNPYLSMTINEVSKLPINNAHDVSNMLSYLNGEAVAFHSSSDIASAVNIIDRISLTNLTNENPSHVYSIADKLLSSSSTSEMKAAQHLNQSLVKLLSSLETFSQTFQSVHLDQSFNTNSVAVSIINMPTNRPKPIVGFAFDPLNNQTFPMGSHDVRNHSTSIMLDSQALTRQNRLVFSAYDHQSRLFDDEHYRVLTRVLSLTIDKPALTQHLRSFVKMNFYLKNQFKQNNVSITCAYWHIRDNQTAYWSTEGCRLIDYNEENVICECDHLTHFAILMDLEQKPLPKAVEQLFSIITFIGLGISSLGLCLTILTFVLFKKLRRHFSQKSLLLLSCNLLLVNILFLILRVFTWKTLSCIIVASLLHYFILSSFSWMFIMALIQYLLFVKVFPRSVSAFTRKAAAFAQLVPLIPVGMILAIDPWNYTRREDGFCWLTPYPLFFSLFLPIALCILINSILFSIVARALLCGKTGQQLRSTQMAESQRLSRFFVALSCFVVVGLTWTVGLFIFGPIGVLFQLLFCVCASLTGFLIFVLYILTSKAKQTCWNNAFKTLGIPSIYSPTLSTSSALTGHKDLSTTSTTDQQKVPSRHLQFPSQPQHFIDAYMPSSPPPPAPPLPLPPSFLIEGDDPLPLNVNHHFYEARHVWAPQNNYIYENNAISASPDDYSLFYASNHDATKL